MFVYSLNASTKAWGENNAHACQLLTITNTTTGETRSSDDFTFLDFEEGDEQEVLEGLFEQL